jgi:ankyrin repeat protein
MMHNRGFTVIKYIGLAIGISLSSILSSNLINMDHLDLYQAIHDRNLSLARQLISQGSDINQPTPHGATPLHFSAKSGQIPMTQLLLQSGANPHAVYQAEWTPLHFAAQGGHVEVAALLLKHGAHLDGIKGKITPLHLAVQEHQRRMASFLLAQGATVEASFQEGWTALHVAAQTGDADMARLLLNSGAPIDAANAIGITPLHSAVLSGQHKLTQYLLSRGATCSLPPQPFQIPPLSANFHNLYSAFQELLRHCPNTPFSS